MSHSDKVVDIVDDVENIKVLLKYGYVDAALSLLDDIKFSLKSVPDDVMGDLISFEIKRQHVEYVDDDSYVLPCVK